MKRIIGIIIAAAMAVAAVSCEKEIGDLGTPYTGKVSVSVAGLMGEYLPETKANLVNSVRVAWVGGEDIYVYDGKTYLGSLSASLDGDNDRYAMLSGEIDAPTGDKLYLVYSPLLESEPAISGGKLSISLAEQNTGKAPFVVYATLDYSAGGENIQGAIASFFFATSVVRVNCTGLLPGTEVDSASLSDVNTTCVLTFGDGGVVAGGADPGTITRTDADGFNSVNTEGDASFQLAVPALTQSTSRTLSVAQGDYHYEDANFAKSGMGTNLSVNTICTMALRSTISASSPDGTVGLLDGRRAMVVTLDGEKYAVALMNEGATAETGQDSYGNYYYYEEALPFFSAGVSNMWRVPTQDEFEDLIYGSYEFNDETHAIDVTVTEGSVISLPLAGTLFGYPGEEEIREQGQTCAIYTSTYDTESDPGHTCITVIFGNPEIGWLTPYGVHIEEPFGMSMRLFYKFK